MNLACRKRFRTSFRKRSAFGDAVKKSLPNAIPSAATYPSNMTQASRWPFWNKAWASIKFTSDPGPDPISAGRIAGKSSAGRVTAERKQPRIEARIFVEKRMGDLSDRTYPLDSFRRRSTDVRLPRFADSQKTN